MTNLFPSLTLNSPFALSPLPTPIIFKFHIVATELHTTGPLHMLSSLNGIFFFSLYSVKTCTVVASMTPSLSSCPPLPLYVLRVNMDLSFIELYLVTSFFICLCDYLLNNNHNNLFHFSYFIHFFSELAGHHCLSRIDVFPSDSVYWICTNKIMCFPLWNYFKITQYTCNERTQNHFP